MQFSFPLANIPGNAWNTDTNPGMSDHLGDLMRANIPTLALDTPQNQLFVMSTGAVNGVPSLVIDIVPDLLPAEVITLNALVPHGPDYFVISQDGGATFLGDPAEVDQVAGPNSSATVTLQIKDGAGVNSAGYGTNAVSLKSTSLFPLDPAPGYGGPVRGGVCDGNGKFAFIVGASLSRGAVDTVISIDRMPQRTLTTSWS